MKNHFKIAIISLLSLAFGCMAIEDSSIIFSKAKADDSYESITLSDCYFSGSDYQYASNGTGISLDNDVNHWGKYDWTANENTIDLHFNAVVGTAESEFYVYLGNDQNEGGCIFLIQFQAAGLMTYAYSCLKTFQNPVRWDSLGFTGTSNEYDIRLKVVFDETNYLADATIDAINLTRNSNNPKSRTVEDIALPGVSHAREFDSGDIFVRLFRRGTIHDITVFDHWNTVTFKDGESTSYRKVTRNDALGELPTPQGIDGGVFDKWVDENNNEVTADLIVDRNLTIKAKYTKTYYVVTFNDNDNLTNRNINIGNPIGELPTPQGKDNYLFDKWVDSNGEEVTSAYVPDDDVTIYAKYMPKISNDRVTLKDLDIGNISHTNYEDGGFAFAEATNYIGQYDLKENDKRIDLSFNLEADKAVGNGGNQIILRCFENIETKPNKSGFRIYIRFNAYLNNLFLQVDDISDPGSSSYLGAYNDVFNFIDKTFYTVRVIFGYVDEENCSIQVYVGETQFINISSFKPNVSYLNDSNIRFGDCYGSPKVKDSFNTVTLIDHVNNTENKYSGYYGVANPDIPSNVTAPADKEGYVFSGWFNNEEEIDNQTPYSGNKVYMAKWLNEFDKEGPTIIDDDLRFETGSFNNFDYDSLISDACGSYEILKFEFSDGCLDEYDCFIEGQHILTIEAMDIFFNKTNATIRIIVANKYTVRFISEGKELLLLRLYEGETPVYSGETPHKENDAYNSYTFTGWDKQIAPVTANVDYIARFAATALDNDDKGQEEDFIPPKANVAGTIIIITSSAVAGLSLIGVVLFIFIKKKK